MTAAHPAPDPGPSRARRVVAAGAAALGLLAVAAVASGGDGGGRSGGIGLPDLGWLVALVFVVLVAIGLVTFVALLVQKRERRPRSATSQLRTLLIAAAVVIALLLLAGRSENRGTTDQPPEPADEEQAERPPADLAEETAWRDVSVLLGLIVVGAAVAVVAAGRARPARRHAGDDEVAEAAALSDVLDEAIAALRADPDPRRAVIGAYAHVERSLRYHRLPRRPSEAPLEFLARLLEHLDASGPAIRRLTGLFERAMFSAHAIDQAAQREAVDALVAVRDELRALAARRDGRA